MISLLPKDKFELGQLRNHGLYLTELLCSCQLKVVKYQEEKA